MTALTVKVEVAFASQPEATTQTWTDISGKVILDKGITINHGRTDAFSQVQAGTATLTLDNSDGRFTPDYTSGTYYPNVKLFKRCRISVTDGTTTWQRFEGRVDAWPTQWAPAGKYAEATITVVDRMKMLAKTPDLPNPISAAIKSLNPVAYWTMSDRAGSQFAENYVAGGEDRMYVQDDVVTFGSATGPGTDSMTAVFAPNQNGGEGGGWLRANRSSADPFKANGDYSMVCFFLVNGYPTDTDRPIYSLTDTYGYEYGLYIHQSSGWVWPPDMSITGPIGSINYCDNATHFFGFTHNNSTDVGYIYMDDLNEGSSGGGHVLWGDVVSLSVFGNPASRAHANNAVVAHAAFFDRVLTATEMQSIQVAGTNGYWGDSTGARVSRLLGFVGVPAAQQNCEDGRSFLDVQGTEGANVLDLIQQCAESEDGVFFVGKDGLFTFQGRDHRWNTASSFTLSAGQYEEDLTPLLDDFGVMNDISVSYPNADTDARAFDTTSQADYGIYEGSASTVLIADQAADHARYLLALYKDPKVRWPTVKVDFLTQTSVRAGVLTAEIGTLFTLSGLPSQAPASSVQLAIEGWQETLSLEEQTITFNTTVVPSWFANIMVLGDATYGVIGSNYLAGDK